MKGFRLPKLGPALIILCVGSMLVSCTNTNPRPRPGGPTSNLDPKAWNTPQPWEGGAAYGMFPQSR
jgi:hypothetical protein